MVHQTLIATIVVGLGLAFVFGAVAHRLKIPLLIGYILAGVVIGPFTPGYVADQTLALQLAEVGVILLMFGVGLHFSLHDLLSVKAVAVPGAIGQMVLVSALGFGLAKLMGWSSGAGVIFGLALSVASTVVVLRAMQERRLIDTDRGRIIVGWLIVEDLAMVLVLVLLPALATMLGGQSPQQLNIGWFSGFLDPHSFWSVLGLTVAKLTAYLLLMLVVGQRVIPLILHYVAHSGSRELFRLSVLVLALGVAFGSAELFGVSFALGAFFAGMVLAEFHPQPAGRAGNVAAAGRVRGAVFRVRWHAVRSQHYHAGTRTCRRDLPDHRVRQCACRIPDRSCLAPIAVHRRDWGRRPVADRRVLLHPCGLGRRTTTTARKRPGLDPCRRDPLDPREPDPVFRSR